MIRLGWVSLLTDISSEMLYPLVPIFLTTVLGAPMAALGLMEGLAESVSNVLKIFSGWWSDQAGKRRPFVIGGYSLSAFSKPLLVFAQFLGWPFVLAMRILDRTGKGLRTSARDALIADYTPESQRGKAFGLHRAMDSLGAVLGPLAALFFMSKMTSTDPAAQALSYRQVFLWAFVPAVLGVALLLLVKEKPFTARYKKPRFGWKSFNRDFKIFIFINLIFAIGNSSDVFLIIRAKDLFAGTANAVVTVILAYVLYNLTYSLGSYPAGLLADRFGSRKVYTFGLLLFSLVYLGFAFNNHPAMVWVLFAVYGFYTAFTDGVGKAYASKLVPEDLRATGMGVYHMSSGLATFAASAAAGLLWQVFGFRAAFLYGAGAALLAVVLFVFLVKGKK
ncbi:MFS transporter [candidate division TA06 bacterium]|nr:MFS transporter [candidate division TA06 bacterium]